MFKHRIKFFLAAPFLVIAILCTPYIAIANSINDTFTDIASQGLDPGNLTLIDEHGGTSSWWADNDEDVSLVWNYAYGTNYDLRVNITNTSSHTMWDTILAFEESAFTWQLNTLAADTWDGTDSSGDAAYWFGDIASGASAERIIDVRYGEAGYLALNLMYNSIGLDSGTMASGSNVSITHISPEPISSILFVTGGAVFAGRRYFKRKRKTT